MRARFPIGSGPVVFWGFLVFVIDRGGREDGRQASGCERRRTDQAGDPRAARLARPGARRRHESFRGRGRAATQVPRRLPAGRPRRAPPTQRCRPRARLHLHGPLQDPGRGPHRQAIPRARRAGGPLRQRHVAGHDATGQPVSRRGEGRPEGYDPRAERRARHDARRLRRRAAQRDVLPGAAPRRVARSGVPDGPPHLRAPAPPHARLPRDLAQRRAGRVRGADARARSDLRRALSAAQVQDGDSVSGRQLHRRLQQRSGFPGDPRRGPHCRIQRAGRWGAGDDRSFYGLFVENGRILDTEHVRLRTAVRRIVRLFGAGVHFTPQQNVLLTGIPDGRRSALETVLAHHGVRSMGAISTVRRWSMACPALPTCGLALAEAERALPGVIDELERELARLGLADLRLTVRMTGCPNGCARPYTADLAFVGRSADKYTIFVGGSVLGTRLATAYADLVPRHRLAAPGPPPAAA